MKDKMARWEVCSIENEIVQVADVDDSEDTRCFPLDHLERVSGGADEVVGYACMNDETPIADASWGPDDEYIDDPYDDADTDFEIPSLFDDPVKLQLEEDKDDPDAQEDADVA